MMRSMMDSPMVQQLMNNPDIMRQLITSNPQMSELMEVSSTTTTTYKLFIIETN